MKNLGILLVSTFLILVSCTKSQNNDDLVEKENELLKRELEIAKRENELNDFQKKKSENEVFNPESEVAMNLIYCENEKFTIRVDRLKNETIRYLSWNKPNRIDTNPNLILNDGIIDKQGTMGGYNYIFKNNEWTYIIEDLQMGETMESMGIFLKLTQNDNQLLYTKMKSIKN
jgi:hypothetical protein